MWLSGESQAASVGVRMTSAPRARRSASFSRDILFGRVMITEYPLSVVFSTHSSRIEDAMSYLDGATESEADA